MESELLARLKTLGADLPEVNPYYDYDPNNPPEIRRGGGGGDRRIGEPHSRRGENREDRVGRGGGQNRERRDRN